MELKNIPSTSAVRDYIPQREQNQTSSPGMLKPADSELSDKAPEKVADNMAAL